jgi:hypothetical protein
MTTDMAINFLENWVDVKKKTIRIGTHEYASEIVLIDAINTLLSSYDELNTWHEQYDKYG